MFEEIPDKGSWLPSFLLQQVLATFICPVLATIVALPLWDVGWVGYLPTMALPALIGYKVQRTRSHAIEAGKWVWILPTTGVLSNIYDWTHRESLRNALFYTFSPDAETTFKGNNQFFITVPACATVGYIIGLFIGARKNLADGTGVEAPREPRRSD